MSRVLSHFLMVLVAIGAAFPLAARSAGSLQAAYEKQARETVPGFTGFSAARGQRFFSQRHGNDWSCTSCHTRDPRQAGRHAVTGRVLAPLAPAANPKRLRDPVKVEKWFRRNCSDVLGRECTVLEKGDVIAWLESLPAGGQP